MKPNILKQLFINVTPKIAILAFCLFSFACNNIDEASIKPPQMEKILADIHIAEAKLQSIKKEQRDSIAVLYYQKIFEINEITEQSFHESIEWYAKNPKIMRNVYENILEDYLKE